MLDLNAFWLRWRWTLLVGALVLLVISGGILNPNVWDSLAVNSMAPGFADMEALLAAGEAWAAGYDPYRIPNLFDSFHRPHIYGPAWLITGAGGFTVAHVAEFSVLTILFFLGSLGFWYRPHSGRTAVAVLAALLSPSILLGLERANNDLIMVVLISLTAVISRHKGWVPVFGIILLLASTAWLKLYPLAAGIALFALPGGLWEAVKRMSLWGLLTFFGFLLYTNDYRRLLRHIPVEPSIFSYDLRYAFIISLGGIPNLRLWVWLGTLLAVGLFIKILWGDRRAYWRALPLTGPWAFFTVSATSIWVGCLLVGPSFRYRAVWLLPLLAWAASPAPTSPSASRALCQWIIFALWVWWLQWQSHYTLIDGQRFEYQWLWAIVLGLTQASVLLTTALLAWLLLGWGWRRGCSLVCPPPSEPEAVIPEARAL